MRTAPDASSLNTGSDLLAGIKDCEKQSFLRCAGIYYKTGHFPDSLLYFQLMSRNVKKTLAFLAGSTAGIFFVLSVCIDAMMVMDYMHGELSGGAACLILAFSMIVMLVCMIFVIFFNRVFDEGEGIVQKTIFSGRWPMNVLFISLAMTVIFIMAYVDRYQTGLLRSSLSTSPALFLFAVVFSAVLYLRNYHRFIPRNKQIRAARKTYALKNRRFTFTIERFCDDGSLEGVLNGELHAGDRAFALSGLQKGLKLTVAKILVNGKRVRKTKDTRAVIRVDIPEKGSSDFVWNDFTVISNVRPGHAINRRVVSENPRISGMLSAYGNHLDDNDFMSTFVFDIVHGQYLVPAKTDDESARSGDVTETMRGSHNVMFQSVSSSHEPDKSVFPIFTDWDALSRYENVMEDDKTVVLIMDFQQASGMQMKGYEGIVINPFGPASFYLSPEYIQSIKSLEGYRREFILKEDTE